MNRLNSIGIIGAALAIVGSAAQAEPALKPRGTLPQAAQGAAVGSPAQGHPGARSALVRQRTPGDSQSNVNTPVVVVPAQVNSTYYYCSYYDAYYPQVADCPTNWVVVVR